MNNNKKSLTKLEDLPNELFYEIQHYLTLNDIYESFFNLNDRFNDSLLSMINLHFEIRSSVNDQNSIRNYFSSRITSLIIPLNSSSVSIGNIYPNVRSIIFYRPIRLIPTKFPLVERIKIDLSLMKPKQLICLISYIFSNKFSCLTTFYILHRKSNVIGFWKPLVNSISNSSITLKKFIFDIKPTIEWKFLEDLIKNMPNLKKILIKKLNTRSPWTVNHITNLFLINLKHLEYVYLNITTLGTKKIIELNEYSHPLFKNITNNISKSKKLYSTTIITSSNSFSKNKSI